MNADSKQDSNKVNDMKAHSVATSLTKRQRLAELKASLILKNIDSGVNAEEAALLGAQAFLLNNKNNKSTAEILEMVQKLVADTDRFRMRVLDNLERLNQLQKLHERKNLS